MVDIDNVSRLETCVITGDSGSGCICLNGVAARCVDIGDKVIIMAYADLSTDEIGTHKPKVIFINDRNEICEIADFEKHGDIK